MGIVDMRNLTDTVYWSAGVIFNLIQTNILKRLSKREVPQSQKRLLSARNN